MTEYDSLIMIEGQSYSRQDILLSKPPDFVQRSEFHRELYHFLQQWCHSSESLELYTSGSTGKPQKWIAAKQKMQNSAQLTCTYLQLKKGDKALLCLPLEYIAGKMMVIRAIVAGLDLYPIAPCGNPLQTVEQHFQFAAMIPLQVFNSLQQPIERQRLQNIENLIIGGGAIDSELEAELVSFPQRIYSTYGMTETLSHIALRQLNSVDATLSYHPFSSVSLSLSPDDTLIIDAPLVCDQTLLTNDIAQINTDGSFRILGRKNNIVNSGGIKIHIEDVESALKKVIKTPFAISAYPDAKFGEVLVLLVQQEIVLQDINTLLPQYQQPKKIINVAQIPMTLSGKINRAEVKKIVLQYIKDQAGS